MINVIASSPNVVYASRSISFIDAGINNANTNTIYLIDTISKNYKSYKPGRTINKITGFEKGKGYLIIANTSFDLTTSVKSEYNMYSLLNSYNVYDYGAKLDGSTDAYSAIMAAQAAMPTAGGQLYFPSGKILVNQEVILSKPITVIGDGAPDVDGYVDYCKTKIFTTNPNINVFKSTGVCVSFEKLGIFNKATTTPGAGSGIRIQSNGFGNRFRDISINGFYDNMFFFDGGEWSMVGCQFQNSKRYGLYISRQGTPDGGDMLINACHFFNGAQAGIKYVNGGGLNITNSKFNCSRGVVGGVYSNIGGNYSIDVDINLSTTDFILTGCSLEGFNVSAVKMRTSAGATFGHVSIKGNQISPATEANSQPQIDISGMNLVGVVGNEFTHNGNQTAVSVANCNTVKVTENDFYGFSTIVPVVSTGNTNAVIQTS